MSVYNNPNVPDERITHFEDEMANIEEDQYQEPEEIISARKEFEKANDFYQKYNDDDEKRKIYLARFPSKTKYERTRVLSIRAEQIQRGAPPLVDFEGLTNPLDIAKKEMDEKKLPFFIERPYPDGTIIRININELL